MVSTLLRAVIRVLCSRARSFLTRVSVIRPAVRSRRGRRQLDVEGILAFAERILPRASDLWVQASLDYKQRLQQLFFPEGIAFDGIRFDRTAVTAPLFNCLAPSGCADERVVTLTFASWNQIHGGLRRLEGLRGAA